VPPVAPAPVVIAISRRLLIVVVTIVLAVSAGIGVTLALLLGQSSSGQAGGSAEPSAAVDGAAGSPQASPGARVTVRLVDVPAGAEVTVDGQPVGAEFQLEASVQERALRVVVPGQRPFVRIFRPVADMTISVRLEPAGP
jgi:hypothetical protein